MRHPAYQLRANKAIDRFLLVEILSALGKEAVNLDKYHYYTLGGPFLEDCRLLAQHFPSLRMTSLEANENTYRRQKFHHSCRHLKLRHATVQDFLVNYEANEPTVFWLDYTDFVPDRIKEFQRILGTVAVGSVVKITVRADLDDRLPDRVMSFLQTDEIEKQRKKLIDDFSSEFQAVLPADMSYGRLRRNNFAGLVQDMLQIAAQRTLPPGGGTTFQILHSCCYSDQTQMFSLTGIVCAEDDAKKYAKALRGWHLANLKWSPPEKIDMPVLSVKERMLLERHLPVNKTEGRILARALGYNIDDGGPKSLQKLKQYATFYRYYPYFARVSVV